MSSLQNRTTEEGTDRVRPFDLMKRYIVGRFDNMAQVEAEIAAGGQKTCYAVHINSPFDNKIEGMPELPTRTFHVLEETYKWKPGARNSSIKPLLLRFEEGEDGQVLLSSIQWPDYVEAASARHDNPFLQVSWEDLHQTPTFPTSPAYNFDKRKEEFSLDVTVQLSESMSFQLTETFGSERLKVREWLRREGQLVDGYYEDFILYDRKLGDSWK